MTPLPFVKTVEPKRHRPPATADLMLGTATADLVLESVKITTPESLCVTPSVSVSVKFQIANVDPKHGHREVVYGKMADAPLSQNIALQALVSA